MTDTETIGSGPLDKQQVSRSELIYSYGRFVPNKLLELIGKENITDIRLGDQAEYSLTAMFTDIWDFTTTSEQMTPQESFAFINDYLGLMEPVIQTHVGVIDKYIGDAIMAIFPQGANGALDAAIGMLKSLQSYNASQKDTFEKPLTIGIGLNTGLMMIGAVGGQQRIDATVIGDSVNFASRLESLTRIYSVPLIISEHTKYALDDDKKYQMRFLDRIKVKGKKNPESFYEVFENDPPAVKSKKAENLDLFQEGVALYHRREIETAKEILSQCLEACPQDTAAQIYIDRCLEYEETGGFWPGSLYLVI